MIYAYVRVSTEEQSIDQQKLVILEYAQVRGMIVDEFIAVQMSTRKNKKARRLDYLMEKLQPGDTLICTEISRLGRFLGEVVVFVNDLKERGVTLVFLKENITISPGKEDMQTKMIVAFFSLFAEIERDLISERTKEGLRIARAKGKLLGRKKGTSKLDPHMDEIKEYRRKGLSWSAIAKLLDVPYTCLSYFRKARGLY
jgi:DNA invertase Pin-like site-specific DNA recombinase